MVDKFEKYRIVSSIITEHFRYLSAMEYNIVHNGKEVIYPNIELLSIVYASNERKISFSYTERNVREEVIDSFNIMITKDQFSFFSFETYLKTIGIKNPEEKMKLISYEGDFKEGLQKFCEFVKDIFAKQLNKVISGEEWINVGMDWNGYK